MNHVGASPVGVVSRNSIIKLSRKANVPCISEPAIAKVRLILDEKIERLANVLTILYGVKTNSKTFQKSLVSAALRHEQVHML